MELANNNNDEASAVLIEALARLTHSDDETAAKIASQALTKWDELQRHYNQLYFGA